MDDGRSALAGKPTAAFNAHSIFAGGGETGARLAAIDWASTPLGAVETWPQTLRTSLRICLTSRHPIILWWGPDFIVFHNDAYAPTLGIKLPWAAGQPGRVVWSEIWPTIGPMLEGVLRTGEPTWSDDQLLFLERSGYPEETYHTFSYSPIEDDSGTVMGVFTAVTETTTRVLAERRALAARDLAAAVLDARSAEEVCQAAACALEASRKDIPFALFYLIERGSQRARLVSNAGLSPDACLAPATVSVALDGTHPAPDDAEDGAQDGAPWPLRRVAHTNQRAVVSDLAARWGAASVAGGRAMNPHTALVLPVSEPGQTTPTAILVAGVSPCRALDDDYVGFYDLLVSHLAAALASAHAYEAERERAEALAELDRAKTTFFSNVSHEFRTPLTLMLGPLTDSLDDTREPLPESQRERLEVIQRNGMRLLKLVNSLLDFARIEAGRVQAVYEPTDLATLTSDLASAFRSLAEKAGLRLIVDCPPLDNLAELIYVDRDMWEKILLNLLSNAFKYTLAGSITVALRALPAPNGSGAASKVELTVADTGVGIPAAELPRLFERFHRVEGTRARSQEGSGIGLALTRELVHLHGGEISATSQEGEGTTFRVRLPIGKAHLPADRIQAPSALTSTAIGAETYVREAERWLPESESAPPPPTIASLDEGIERALEQSRSRLARIVLADDNADMRDYLRRLLGERYEVEAVGTGTAALAATRRQAPDLILSDVMMPELDGFGLLRALRNDPALRPIPVILLSARAGEEATIEGLEAGADDYLVKPFSAREVLSRVAARLEIARARREAMDRARQLEAVFASVSDGVIVYGPDAQVVAANDAVSALFGYHLRPGFTDLPLDERRQALRVSDASGADLPLERFPQMRALRGETLTGGDAIDLRIGTFYGAEVEVSVSAAPLRDEAGAIIGAVAVYRDVTERRHLERAALWQASMLDRSHDAIFLWELGGPIIYWNHGAELLYGYTKDEAVGRVSHDLLHTRRTVTPAEFAAALDQEGEWSGELTQTTRDGREVIVLSRHQLLREPDGRRLVLETCLDITARLALEREAHQSAERLRAILELLPVGVAFVDASGKAVLVNQAVKAIWGEDVHLSQSQAEYGQYTAWWPETGDLISAEEWGLARALTTGEVSLNEEIDIETSNGTRKTLLASAAPLRDAAGTIAGGMSVIVDVTERKQLERQTHETLEALLLIARTVVEAPESVGLPNRDALGREIVRLVRRILPVRYASLFAVPPESDKLEFLAADGYPPDLEALLRQRNADVPFSARISDAEQRRRLLAGEVVVMDLRRPRYREQRLLYGATQSVLVPMRIGDQFIGTLGLNPNAGITLSERDLSLAQGVAQMAALVIERERLLRERQAGQLRELTLVEATRRMDEFLGLASHELRTPLTSLTANTQMAERALRAILAALEEGQPLDGMSSRLTRAHEQLVRTDRQMRRLDRLVGDLLEVSRISAGKLELRLEDADLLIITREAVKEQQAAWPGRQITRELPRRDQLPIHADADRIGQVLVNYLTNALKYSAPNQPVSVRAGMCGALARVEVRDHGPGLTPSQRALLFERFSRVPGIEQQSGSGVGLGLGLYICKTIIERHGGQVGVESAPGQGSTFWFTLPLAPAVP